MAVGIIPKKAEVKSSFFIDLLFSICVIFLVTSVVVSIFLFLSQLALNRSLKDVNNKLAAVGTPEELQLEKNILLTKQKIDDFDYLLNSHRSNLKFFTNIESLSHPDIFFTKVELKINQGKVSFSGLVDNFEILGQQFLILKEQNYIKDVSLAKASIEKDGKINFTYDVSFNQGEFKF